MTPGLGFQIGFVPAALRSGRSETERTSFGSRWDCGRHSKSPGSSQWRAPYWLSIDSLVLEVTADMLKDLGCEVVIAASGPDASERLSENATDLNMPGRDGYELVPRAAAIRKPSWSKISLTP